MAFKHKDQGPPLHVYVCTPAYNGQVDDAYAQSMQEASYCCPAYNVQVTAGIVGNVGFIELARNIFVKKFLEEHTDCTHLFFIDGDIQFESRAFIGLIRSGQPICAGVYRRRQAKEDYPLKPADNPDGGGLWFVDDWLQCERVPTGFLCITRKVLEEMADEAPVLEVADQPGGVPWLFDLKHEPMDNTDLPICKNYKESRELRAQGKEVAGGFRLIGEDYTFCDKYIKKYGKMVPVWSNFDFSHHGFKGNLWNFLNRMKDEADGVKFDGGVVTRMDGNTGNESLPLYHDMSIEEMYEKNKICRNMGSSPPYKLTENNLTKVQLDKLKKLMESDNTSSAA